jgi:hypothetical protein
MDRYGRLFKIYAAAKEAWSAYVMMDSGRWTNPFSEFRPIPVIGGVLLVDAVFEG